MALGVCRPVTMCCLALNLPSTFYLIQLGSQILGRVFSTATCLARERRNTKNRG